jgi:peptidoglycan hydrolase-like protein with peptidoglycan-binding domain
MAESQNGWPVSSVGSEIGIVKAVVPGTDISIPGGIKGGDVATVMLYLAAQFHHAVEPLRRLVCGGYVYRKIDGYNVWSNHASGTAFDFNWDKHPMGASGTFTVAQVTTIRNILRYLEGVVRWGGDYSTRKDEMHFEINTGAAGVARIAQKIKSENSTTTPLLSVDGKLGPKTISKWQKVMGTPVDGVISNPSRLVMAVQRRLKATVDSRLVVDGVGIFQDGKRYKTAGALQRYLRVPVDEIISTPVSETVKALQRRLNENRF